MLSWHLRIGTRLTMSFTLILALMSFTTALSIWRLYSVDRMAKVLVNEKLSKQQRVADWQNAVDLNATRATAIAKSDSLELGEYFAGLLEQGDKDIGKLAASMAQAGHGGAEASLVHRIDQAGKAYLAVRENVFRLKAIGKTIEVERLVATELDSALARYQAGLRALAEYHKAQAEAIAQDAGAVFRHSVLILVAVGAATVLIGGFLALYLSRSIVKPVQAAASIAMRVADGDLTSVADSAQHDEIGDLMRALQKMNDSLARMAMDIQEGVTEIDGALAVIGHDNKDLSHRTVAQAQSLRTITGSMEAITATVQANARHTQQANALAVSAAQAATKGGATVAEAVRTMATINESSKKIVDIIGMIDGIAFQTNILALNTAVEAAHAGEHGRGFAVVAGEIRTLSHRSATAAREIRKLINLSVADIAAGTKLVDEAGAGMQQVVASINQVTGIMAHIKTASEQQTQDLMNVGRSIDQIDKTTHQNSELVQQAVQAIGELSAQSVRVARSVSQFRFDAVAPRLAPAPPVRSEAVSGADADGAAVVFRLGDRTGRHAVTV